MRKICMALFITAVLIISLYLVSGCGGSANTMKRKAQPASSSDDIDELLGLSDSGEESEKSKDITEDDVLKLLGVVDKDSVNTSKNSEISQSERNEPKYNRYDYKDDNVRSQTSDRTAGVEMDTRSYTERYNEAFQFYKNRSYLEAIEMFNKLILENSNHDLSDNCQYWIGECYYDMQNYEQAILSFEKVFSFTNSNKDDDAQLKLGICYHKLNENEKAKEEFQRLITYYPDSEFVSIARSYLNKYN